MSKGKSRVEREKKRRAMRRVAFAAAVERNDRDANGQLVMPSKYRTRRAARARGVPMASRSHESRPWWSAL